MTDFEMIQSLSRIETETKKTLDKLYHSEICRMLKEVGNLIIKDDNRYDFPVYSTTLDENGEKYIPYKEISLCEENDKEFLVIPEDDSYYPIEGNYILHRELEELWENVNCYYQMKISK